MLGEGISVANANFSGFFARSWFQVQHPPLGCAHITGPGLAYQVGAHVPRGVPDFGPSWSGATEAAKEPQSLTGFHIL